MGKIIIYIFLNPLTKYLYQWVKHGFATVIKKSTLKCVLLCSIMKTHDEGVFRCLVWCSSMLCVQPRCDWISLQRRTINLISHFLPILTVPTACLNKWRWECTRVTWSPARPGLGPDVQLSGPRCVKTSCLLWPFWVSHHGYIIEVVKVSWKPEE